MFDIPNCACGREGKYMNMSCGNVVWTCEKWGCAHPPKITTTDNTRANKEKE